MLLLFIFFLDRNIRFTPYGSEQLVTKRTQIRFRAHAVITKFQYKITKKLKSNQNLIIM
jgi:hypothetical protein